MNIKRLYNAKVILEETGIALEKCPFCGDGEDLKILNVAELLGFQCSYDCDKMLTEISELHHDWSVNCPSCGCLGPDFCVSTDDYVKKIEAKWFHDTNPKTDEEAILQAIDKWNGRAKEMDEKGGEQDDNHHNG